MQLIGAAFCSSLLRNAAVKENHSLKNSYFELARRLLSHIGMNICAITLILAALTATASPVVKKGGLPPIELVQKKAIEHARLDPSEISSWKKRARLAALLPKIQLDYSRRLKNDINIDISDSVYVGSSGTSVGPEEGSYSETANSDDNIGVKAVWSFNETIFNPDMLAVSEEARLLARERQTILAEVNKNYFDRERAKTEIDILTEQHRKKPADAQLKLDIMSRVISIKESNAALDALTGGWFSSELSGPGDLKLTDSK